VPGYANPDVQGNLKKLRFPPRIRLPGTQNRRTMRVWMATAPDPSNGISHARIAEKLTRENWLEKAVVRQGPTSIYYIYILYAGTTPDEGPWKVEVHGKDVNWEYYPRSDDFSQEFADLDDALRYANGEDDSHFARARFRPGGRTGRGNVRPSLMSLSNLVRGAHRRANREAQRGGDDRTTPVILTGDSYRITVPAGHFQPTPVPGPGHRAPGASRATRSPSRLLVPIRR
jgi:hypothetical protein